MITAVDEGSGDDVIEATPDVYQSEHPAMFGERVKASGLTPAGLLVELVDYDEVLKVGTVLRVIGG